MMSPIRATLRAVPPPEPVKWIQEDTELRVLGTFQKGDVLTVEKIDDMVVKQYNDAVKNMWMPRAESPFIRAMVTNTYEAMVKANLISPPSRFTRWNRTPYKRAPSLVIGRAA